MEIHILKYKTKDLYEWGEGWVSSNARERWESFCEDFESYTIRKLRPQGSGECWQFVTVYSSVYLHPMSGMLTLHSESEVKQFKKLITDICEYAGGSVSFATQSTNINIVI